MSTVANRVVADLTAAVPTTEKASVAVMAVAAGWWTRT
jgi:hypothetical protein